MLVLLGWVSWLLGEVDEAVSRMTAALERADAVQHAHTHAYAWYYASVLHAIRSEPDDRKRLTRSVVGLSRNNTGSDTGLDSPARSGASVRRCWIQQQADSTR